MIQKLITITLALLILSSIGSAAGVNPPKDDLTAFMQDYNLNGENNSLQLACEIGQNASEQGWNCDVREITFGNHTPVYIDVFYPAADNKKGYDAYYGWFGPQKKEVTGFWGKDHKMMYRDWGSSKTFNCYLSGVKSYPIVKSYFGNVTSTAPVRTQENDNTKPHHDERPVQSIENSTIINASGNQNDVDNSTNTVNNQGIIDKIEQYWFDFSNTNWSNVTLNFFGGN